MLRHLDLFSGIGGFALGLQRTGGFQTIGFCEIDPFCQKVLRKHWPDVPIYEDVRLLDADGFRGTVDIITGGFPCQPWSVAGNQEGAKDDRDLWPEMVALIEDIQPQWVIGENVRGFAHQPLGLPRTLTDLERIGYQVVTFIVPAAACGAPHKRDRCWIVAHANSQGEPVLTKHGGERQSVAHTRHGSGWDIGSAETGQDAQRKRTPHHNQTARPSGEPSSVADTNSIRLEEHGHGKPDNAGKRNQVLADTNSTGRKEQRGAKSARKEHQTSERGSQRHSLMRLDRMADGLSAWMDEPCPRVATGQKQRAARLKGLGNAVIPQIPEMIGYAILEACHD